MSTGETFREGSTTEFDRNWRTRPETLYNHWTAKRPANQIQLAFRRHWHLFRKMMGPLAETRGKMLEVGCGRGSLSSYFASDSWDVTLLDYSAAVIETAKKVFAQNRHKANFVVGDANALPFEDQTFDVVASIGLLEHFEDIKTPMVQQHRILKPGGWFFGYIVPERPDNVQKYFNWVNRGLKRIIPADGKNGAKADIFRSDSYSDVYVRALDGLSIENLSIFGMYPLPMVSHSPEFPFSLLPAPAEFMLTRAFEVTLSIRELLTKQDGWICSEQMGQAFLVAFQRGK